MSKTYLDYFNHTLNQFLNELISYFPFTKEGILNNYRGLLEGKDRKSDLYAKYYMSKVNDKLKEIATRDPHLFEKEHLYLIEGVDNETLYTLPVSLTITPKNPGQEISITEINKKLNNGIELPSYGVSVHKDIHKTKMREERKTNIYKIIGIIVGVVITVSLLLYMIYRYKKKSPLEALLS